MVAELLLQSTALRWLHNQYVQVAAMEGALNAQYDQMQDDIDAMGAPESNAATSAGVFLFPPGMQAKQPRDRRCK